MKFFVWLDRPATADDLGRLGTRAVSGAIARALEPVGADTDPELSWVRGLVVAWVERPTDPAADAAELARAIGAEMAGPVVEQLQCGPAAPPAWPGPVRVGFLMRQPELDPVQFERLYRAHGRIVHEHGPLFSRYTVNFPLDGAPKPSWDAVVEQWFTDRQTWTEHDRQVREEKPAVAADVARLARAVPQFVSTDVAMIGRGEEGTVPEWAH